MQPSVPAYRGDDEYVFICYSHKDAEAVYQELTFLDGLGIKIWYDEGIRPGLEWTSELANAIAESSMFLYFATPNSTASRHCRDEIQFAQNHDIPLAVVQLEEVEYPPGLELTLGSIQAVRKYDNTSARYEEQVKETFARFRDELATRSAPPIAEPPTKQAKKRGPWIIALTAVALAAFVVIAANRYVSQEVPAAFENHTIALLPFQDNGGFDDPYYPESLAEDLLNRLVSIEGLQVASRRASFAHASNNNLSDVATALRVANVLTGTIRRATDGIRLHLELVSVASGNEVVQWSRTFEKQSTADLLEVLATTTELIAAEFYPGGLDALSKNRIEQHSTKSDEAFEFYLQAKAKQRSPATSTSVEETAALFRQAIELDPTFAWAQAGLCQTYLIEFVREQTIERAKPVCEKLLGLNAGLFEVRLALGRYFSETGQFDEAVRFLEQAVELNARSDQAYALLASALANRFYTRQNELDRNRADEIFRKAIQIDPTYWGSYHSYASFLSRSGLQEAAVEQLEAAVARRPDSMPSLNNLANIQYRLGNRQTAERTWKRSLAIDESNIYAHSGLGILYYFQGDLASALQHQLRSTELSPLDHRGWGRLGSFHLASGNTALASDALDKAIDLATKQLEIDPNNWRHNGFLALYHALQMNHQEASRYITTVFEINPLEEGQTHHWAGMVAFQREDFETAFNEFERSLQGGFSSYFLANDPLLADFKQVNPDRFAKLIDKYTD